MSTGLFGPPLQMYAPKSTGEGRGGEGEGGRRGGGGGQKKGKAKKIVCFRSHGPTKPSR